jgi:hypothetical protein
MKSNLRWLGWVEFVGVFIMYMGILIPLEGKSLTDGSLILLMGSILITLVAFLKMKLNRQGLLIGLILMLFGVAYLFMLSSYPASTAAENGFLWYLPGLTYPIGWLLTVVILSMRVFKKKPSTEDDNSTMKGSQAIFSSDASSLSMATSQKHSTRKSPKRIVR